MLSGLSRHSLIALIALVVGASVVGAAFYSYATDIQMLPSVAEAVATRLSRTKDPSKSRVTPTSVKFVTFDKANFPEQDVFFLDPNDQTKVIRLTGDELRKPSTLSQQLYTAAIHVPRDVFKTGINPLGPYPKGKALGFTLADWYEASGSGTVIFGATESKVSFTWQNLVPNATYTLWCIFVTPPPNDRTVNLPCGNPDGSQTVFRTDTKGNASYEQTFTNKVQPPTEKVRTAFGIAYHSEGNTCGASYCEFGKNSHVHLFAPIPLLQKK